MAEPAIYPAGAHAAVCFAQTMPHAHTPLTQQRLEGYHAFGLYCALWLARLMTLLGPVRKNRRIHLWLTKLERFAERFVFLVAEGRVPRLPQRNRSYVRRSAPRGFRRMLTHHRLLFKIARIRARGNATTRIARLLDVFADPEPYIARFVSRLLRGLRGSRLFATHPCAQCISAPAMHAISAANTS